MKSTSYRLPESVIQWVDKLAAKLGMTKTQVIVVAIRDLHQKENNK